MKNDLFKKISDLNIAESYRLDAWYYDLFANWKDVIGDKISEECFPHKYDENKNILYLKSKSNHSAFFIYYDQKKIVEIICKKYGLKEAFKIKFI